MQKSRSFGGDEPESNHLFNEFEAKMGSIFEEEVLLVLDFSKLIS
jgi:hypothetical protein